MKQMGERADLLNILGDPILKNAGLYFNLRSVTADGSCRPALQPSPSLAPGDSHNTDSTM
ncbi:MAG: hypothetical protein RL120_13745 [Gammaproteobacteria bacterium]